jgi:hypothetical protein
MRLLAGSGAYRVDRRVSPPDLVVLQPQGDGAPILSLHGFRGPALPERLVDPVVELLSVAERRYRLRAMGASIEFHARNVLRHEAAPRAVAPLTAPFALRRRERFALWLLLRLLRLPLGGPLLRAWHERRR